LKTSTDEVGEFFRVVDTYRDRVEGVERRFGGIGEVSCFSRERLAEKAQDGPTERFD